VLPSFLVEQNIPLNMKQIINIGLTGYLKNLGGSIELTSKYITPIVFNLQHIK